MSDLRKELGKIRSVRYGFGGYQEAMFGVSFDLGSRGWGVSDFWGTWANHDKHCKLTKADQAKIFADNTNRLIKIMQKASVQTLDELVGIPIEVTFDVNLLKDWRILEEAI